MKRRLRAWSCWGLLVPLVATMLVGAGVPDAPGKVTSAAVVTDKLAAGPVSFCEVNGVFAPRRISR